MPNYRIVERSYNSGKKKFIVQELFLLFWWCDYDFEVITNDADTLEEAESYLRTIHDGYIDCVVLIID